MEELRPKIRETKWNPSLEVELLKKWEEEKIESKEEDYELNGKELFVIDTPPPYASGKWHVGGAAHYSQIDMISRYFRLKGLKVISPFYADRNGLPVEVQVEKTHNIRAHDMASNPEGRKKFLDLCKNYLDDAEKDIVNVWKRLGCRFDYWKEGTDSERFRIVTQTTFIELYKRGLIYEAERPVRWCPRCGTTLAEAEIEYKEESDYIYYIKFKLLNEDKYITVATTRPELLASCRALVYNPKDERYIGLKGKKAISPIYNQEVEIFEHTSVDKSFGTGLMMVCSYGDENDIRLFKELNLKSNVIISPSGTMLPSSGILSGLTVSKAREKIAEVLEKEGLLEKKERIKHTIPVCWRCKTPLQIINRKEFFLSQLTFKDEIKDLINKIDIRPEMHRKKLIDWIDSISMDWPISRDRYYGTEIPVWRCKKCGSILLPEKGRYYRPWIDEPPFDKCPVCGAPKEYLEGEKRVFDTWFDSSISVLYVTRWLYDNEFFERAIKSTLRPQGEDIIRSWLYYSLLRVYQLTNKPAFKYIRITGMGLDSKGRPMHKSLGNVIDPDPIVSKYGADAFRFWAAIASKLGYDYRFDENKIITGRNFATKIWNLARFVSSFPYEKNVELTKLDKAFLALTQDYLERAKKGYESLDMFEPITTLYELIWDIFASHYVELVKNRAYNRENKYSREEQKSSWKGLHEILRSSLIMLSPIMPFVTDYTFRALYNKTINDEKLPEGFFSEDLKEKLLKDAKKIIEINKSIWIYKKSNGLSLSSKVNGKIAIEKDLKDYIKDLEELHSSEFVLYEKEVGGEKIGENVYIIK
ncbi:MAG: valine--tRNA ligase [Caldisphaera sp.]|nr:MAG: valine--tRNA ligase [Caldisphaera sp.]